MEISAGQFFLHERFGKFEQGGPRRHGKAPVRQPQHKHVVEFQALRCVHRHQLNGIAGFLFQIDLPAGLREIIEIFHEFRKPRRFALGLPFTNELRQSPQVGFVSRTDAER
jgi:hypothetical protein